ncbi:hypothetical protein Caci_3187 [Catenulispora acidiphila DSM 44928]|uniref:Uncharacterized protein n=1 Tax=Catenulispora acidiphila (strain DSM 44928 / JCM 14897 / NBRC 102108 / NRRL B-24433 / ID139908) TaxID=479433 RepID=C7Q689_CATAD|nr:hypothetical protein [Catenulispora acidiphila]ACU72095.1 hypothetical protein Caci_3187 [Catenulispora acidiphila DSM 44928]
MRSIKTTVTAAAVLTAGFVLSAPVAHAATAPQAKNTCHSAIATAEKARHAYDAAAADLKKQIADGGHPGTAEEKNVTDLMAAAKTAVWNAVQSCKGMEDHHRRMHMHPRGAMHTGVGSTSQGVSGGEMAGGVGILGAAGAGALALRRRRSGSES